MRKRRWTAFLWILTGGVVLLLLVKFFVADVYRVDSGSMRPTIFGGRDRADAEEDAEHVLVLYGHGFEPTRFDLVVIDSPDGSKPLVKRVCGLPGDQDLVIRDGDLFVGRARLPSAVPRPAPVPIYDDRWLDPERSFNYRRDGSVHREADAWVVEGGAQPPGSMLQYHPPLRDDYFDRRHQFVPGVIEVNDAVLELEFLVEAPLGAQTLRFQLVEESDTFEVLLAPGSEKGAKLELLRRNRLTTHGASSDELPPGDIVLAKESVVVETARWYALAFSNIDNHLRVRCPDLGLDLRRDYDENVPLDPPIPGHKNLGPRVRFGVEAGRARFRAVRILRDLYYTDNGSYGVGSGPGNPRPSGPITLGPNDYFLLGDNSAASTDSRHFGVVKASQLLGRPVAVVWPRPRWLRAVEPP